MEQKTLEKNTILEWLDQVKDPEIPVLSLVDLGVITNVTIEDTGKVIVNMTPTFAGCPAMDYMVNDVKEVLRSKGMDDFEVIVSYKEPWNSNKITDKGRKALQEFGLTPPPKHNFIVDIDLVKHAKCPNCGSDNTEMQTPFGPTLCRSIHYCNDCKEAFQQFKPV